MPKKLNKLASTSDLMNIDITYGGKRYRFNLFEELEVSEASINKELKTHASSYSFLLQMRSHLLAQTKTLDKQRRKLKFKLFIRYKNEGGVNDLVWAKVDQNSSFVKITEQWIQSELNHGIINNACESFEARKDLIQSLSANVRKER